MNIRQSVTYPIKSLLSQKNYLLSCMLILLLSPLLRAEVTTDSNQELLAVSVGFSQSEMAELTPEEQQEKKRQYIANTKNKPKVKLKSARTPMSKSVNEQANKASKRQTKSRDFLPAQPYSLDQVYTLFSAKSFLLEDYDGDGYYQTFSVVFDADVESYTHGYATSAQVYADLYMSKNGGPWEYYYTTDNFVIIGDREDDEFEVVTTLHQAYYADQYDILIELFETSSDDFVATISADDIINLAALPLESSEYDDAYVESDVYVTGGSLSVYFVLCILLLSIYRRTVI